MPKLTAKSVQAAAPGKHSDGGGLVLQVATGGGRGWLLRVTVDGRRREMGLGPYPAVSLKEARRKAASIKGEIAGGADPLATRKRNAVPTFEEAARTVHELHGPKWSNAKNTANWIRSLEQHAFPRLGRTRIDRIEPQDILGVLSPIWNTKQATARMVRQRIRTVLKWAMAHGYVTQNAAGEAIDAALPVAASLAGHHKALPYTELPEAIEAIRAVRLAPLARLALIFQILTASRPKEARCLEWSEIDLEARLWTVPARRMKTRSEHRVPLSDEAVAVLEEARGLAKHESPLVFASRKRGVAVNDQTVLRVLERTGLADRTVAHGFRTTFRTWAAEQTDAPHTVMELALAHAVGSAVERAYARTDLLERRRVLMEEWGRFVANPPDRGGNVIPLRKGA